MPDYRKILKIVIAFLLCIVLIACTGMATSPASTPTLQVLATTTLDIKTLTNLPATLQRSPPFASPLQSSPTPTPTPRPSDTPAASLQTIIVTANPQATLTRQAFEQAEDMTATQVASFPVACDGFNQYYSLQSPDGNWLAISCENHPDQGLEVVSKEGKRWDLQFIDFLSEEFVQDGGLPRGGLDPLHWTGDGKYLYFRSYLSFSGGGTCFDGHNTIGLYRLNLDDGTVSTTLKKFHDRWPFYEIVFSPDGRRFAYVYDHLAIVDLKTGEEFTIDPEDDVVRRLSWSPDGSQLAYATCHDTQVQDDYVIDKSAIKIFSLKTHASRTILESKRTFLGISFLRGTQGFEIEIDDYQARTTDYFLFDWSTGQLTAVTPTP